MYIIKNFLYLFQFIFFMGFIDKVTLKTYWFNLLSPDIWYLNDQKHIGGVVLSMLSPSAIDRWFGLLSCPTKNNKIYVCCFSAKHTVLRCKSKDWLPQNQDNVSKWSDMSIRVLFFLAHLAKDNVSFCHHLASVVR